MKTTFAILFLSVLPLFAQPSNPTVTATIKLPVQITLPTPEPPAITPPNVTYLAARPDGRLGSGTMTDPLNASDPLQLKTSWAAFIDTAKTNRATLVFLPGTYLCDGFLQLSPLNRNLSILGYGATITLTNGALAKPDGIFGNAWTGNDSITWEGFELDCGSLVKYTGGGKTGGLIVKGNANTVRNIVVRNVTVNDPAYQGHEAFGLIFESTNGICANNSILGAKRYSANGGFTGLAVLGEGNSVTGNTVDLTETEASNGLAFGFTIYGNENTFCANTCRNVDVGLSMDAAGVNLYTEWRDNIVANNQLSANSICLRIDNNTQSYSGWTIANNHLKTKSVWVSLYTYGEAYRSNKISGFKFTNNRFTGSPRPSNNLILGNFKSPHSFTANDFTTTPSLYLGTNANTLTTTANTVSGTPMAPTAPIK